VGAAHAAAAQDAFFGALKHGIEAAAANPYVAYPSAAAGALLLLPATRGAIWRATLGRGRTPETVTAAAVARLAALDAAATGFGAEAQKLAARAAAAEEEYVRCAVCVRERDTPVHRCRRRCSVEPAVRTLALPAVEPATPLLCSQPSSSHRRGLAKLKAARAELQRLSSRVGKSERAAEAILAELRGLPAGGAPGTAQARSDAASRLSTLRSQRSGLEKAAYRIMARDI